MRHVRIRASGTCPLCRGRISGAQKVARVAGKGWCHIGCIIAIRQASTERTRP